MLGCSSVLRASCAAVTTAAAAAASLPILQERYYKEKLEQPDAGPASTREVVQHYIRGLHWVSKATAGCHNSQYALGWKRCHAWLPAQCMHGAARLRKLWELAKYMLLLLL
jgi:hypothetical protein